MQGNNPKKSNKQKKREKTDEIRKTEDQSRHTMANQQGFQKEKVGKEQQLYNNNKESKRVRHD